MMKNNFGCLSYDTIKVNEHGLYIPNSFTPNGDGLNDRFIIPDFEKYMNASLGIFNRYGTRIYETNDPKKGWDGTFKGELCPPGSYVWILRTGINLQRTYKGSVTLIR